MIIAKAINYTENQNKYTNIFCEKNAALKPTLIQAMPVVTALQIVH